MNEFEFTPLSTDGIGGLVDQIETLNANIRLVLEQVGLSTSRKVFSCIGAVLTASLPGAKQCDRFDPDPPQLAALDSWLRRHRKVHAAQPCLRDRIPKDISSKR